MTPLVAPASTAGPAGTATHPARAVTVTAVRAPDDKPRMDPRSLLAGLLYTLPFWALVAVVIWLLLR